MSEEVKNAEAELAKVICRSGCLENGEGRCAAICMDQMGNKPSACRHAKMVHGRLAGVILAAGYRKRSDVLEERRDIKDAPRDGRVIWAHIRADLPPRWPEHQDGSETSAWADRWAPIKHGGVHTYEDGHKLDMHWTIALPVGYGGITDDWFDDWQPTPPKDKTNG